MQRHEFVSPGLGGLDLHAQAWLPRVAPRAVVVVSHGLAEHGGRYERLAQDLVAHDYAVYAVDHRGHGRSPGPRANIERFGHVVSDFATFVGRAARHHPATPVFVLGHSMGGAIAFEAALRLQDRLRGLVLSAPALAADVPAASPRRWIVRLLSAIAPNTGALKLPADAICRDEEVVRAYVHDPLVHRGAVPARTLHELLEQMDEFMQRAPALKLPVLIQHGTADSLVPLAALRPVYQAIGMRHRTLRLYDGLYHEVYNEPERERVVADLIGWLER